MRSPFGWLRVPRRRTWNVSAGTVRPRETDVPWGHIDFRSGNGARSGGQRTSMASGHANGRWARGSGCRVPLLGDLPRAGERSRPDARVTTPLLRTCAASSVYDRAGGLVCAEVVEGDRPAARTLSDGPAARRSCSVRSVPVNDWTDRAAAPSLWAPPPSLSAGPLGERSLTAWPSAFGASPRTGQPATREIGGATSMCEAGDRETTRHLDSTRDGVIRVWDDRHRM